MTKTIIYLGVSSSARVGLFFLSCMTSCLACAQELSVGESSKTTQTLYSSDSSLNSSVSSICEADSSLFLLLEQVWGLCRFLFSLSNGTIVFSDPPAAPTMTLTLLKELMLLKWENACGTFNLLSACSLSLAHSTAPLRIKNLFGTGQCVPSGNPCFLI